MKSFPTPPDADEALRETVRRAYHGSDFFRAHLGEAGVSPDSAPGVDEITRLPFTTKEQLRESYPFGWTTVPQRDVVRIHASSGTTGRRTLCTYTQRDIDDWVEMFGRCMEYAGVTSDDRVQVAAGYGLWTAGWGIQAAAEHVGAMAIPAGPGNTDLHLELMRDLDSTALVSTSSFALLLAERVSEAGIGDEISLRVGLLGSERWGERTRARIEKLLGIRTYDLYGLTELWGPGAGLECHVRDGIHVWSDHYHVEIIDPETLEPAPPGGEGEIVVTTYRKQATPLLRYRTRDLSRIYSEPCPCGSPYPRIARLTGRTDDMIKLRGVMFFPTHVEHVISGVESGTGEFQIHLDRATSGEETFLVRLEALDSPGLAAEVAGRLREEIGVRPVVEVVAPGTLPRTERKTQRIFDQRVH
ncbi:MAG: phenylacetate--CoA ligase family protein [Micromonosporaceae bacterium]